VMLPALVGGSIGIVVASAEVLMLAGTAGMGYGLGRKYGRKACNILDRFEDRIVSGMKSKITVEE
ncbi:MAG: hypothetical protein QF707_04430, partial [Candidatus Poseidoniaceae archaeon]|nr:hypothetical protein [Candidatus Poseidoniaceae archaeon]